MIPTSAREGIPGTPTSASRPPRYEHRQPLSLGIPRRFKLDDTFLARYRTRPVRWGPLGLVTFKRSYARPTCDCDDRGSCGHPSEAWWQAVQRVVEGCYDVQAWHCDRNNLRWSWAKAQASAQVMYALIFDFKFTPPGRGLSKMGTDYMREHGIGSLLNCAFRSTQDIGRDFADPFVYVMDSLMLGVGVGSDLRGAGKFVVHRPKLGEGADGLHVVPDSREGWVEVVERVLKAYEGKDTLPVKVDYSLIRPEGAPIRRFGGIAAGPEPLRKLVTAIQDTLNPLIGKPITSTAIADLVNRIGTCVVAGGVRRSAEILLGAPDDVEFRQLKDRTQLAMWEARKSEVEEALAAGANGSTEMLQAELQTLTTRIESHPVNTHRWASNNSVLSTVGMDYRMAAEQTVVTGEPGYFWLEASQTRGRFVDPPGNDDFDVIGVNPCGEISLADGELCNLVETYPAHHDSYEEYRRTLKWAYLWAKTVTLLPHHDRRTNAVMMHKRRIGLSQAGVVQSFARHGRRTHFAWCDQGYRYLGHLDAEYSRWLAVPRSVRMTTIKPGGSTPLLSGATPGAHYDHSRFYIRRMRLNATSSVLAALQAAGYPSEPDIGADNTWVVEFPVAARHFEVGKTDVTLWEQLENAAQLQHWWSDNGVSCTVNFDPANAGQIRRALELYETRLKGISFMPDFHGYKQAPYETITEDEYRARVAVLQPVDFGNQDVHEIDERFCDSDRCELEVGAPTA